MDDRHTDIGDARERWEAETLAPALERLSLAAAPDRFYGPDDLGAFDFLADVGFPGQFPYTAGVYPTEAMRSGAKGSGTIPQASGFARAGRYSGYGAPEDTADHYRAMIASGKRSGPNLAFDLPTQCGYDSDASMAAGEVGRTGVAIDSMDDFRTIYEPFVGDLALDRVASNWTINAPANVIVAMYFLLAVERGIDPRRLRATPQNDVLKEFVARGTYIYPPRESLRLTRDIFLFATERLPSINVVSAGGYHMREAGATRAQDLGFSMAIAAEYLQVGIEAGIPVDTLAPRLTFNAFGGSLELFAEVAFQRAARRMWARLLRDRFGAINPRSLLLRQPTGAHMGFYSATTARPLNNLTRSVIGGVASALSGYAPVCEPPFDEALGLGWSTQATQLSEDAARILMYEAKLNDVRDPLAGSYYVESLTSAMEQEATDVLADIDRRGGALVAVESGFMGSEITRSAIERQRRIEHGEQIVVGVNAFVGPEEIEVEVRRSDVPYDATRIEAAERSQTEKLAELRRRRDRTEHRRALHALHAAASDTARNTMPETVECLRADATVGEICDVLRDVFGEYTRGSRGVG